MLNITGPRLLSCALAPVIAGVVGVLLESAGKSIGVTAVGVGGTVLLARMILPFVVREPNCDEPEANWASRETPDVGRKASATQKVSAGR
jgi:hypothetical protein